MDQPAFDRLRNAYIASPGVPVRNVGHSSPSDQSSACCGPTFLMFSKTELAPREDQGVLFKASRPLPTPP